jgi:hypothetical protein
LEIDARVPLARLHPGQPVEVALDVYPGHEGIARKGRRTRRFAKSAGQALATSEPRYPIT